MTQSNDQERTTGFIAALTAFIGWGLLPIYWKTLQTVSPMEILCHRILWSLAFISIILTVTHRWRECFAPMRSVRNLALLTASSLMIGGNWLLYIWSVNTGHVLETSLGYYITPLVNVLFGFIFFRERLKRLQVIAIGLATLGVINSIVSYGHVPWISLTLAISFAFYGLIRKVASVDSIPGLFLETMVLAPAALTYMGYLHSQGTDAFLNGPASIDMLLMGAGVVTAMPLIGFAFGARRLRLITLGILQFVAPSIAFLLSVFVFKETFSTSHLLTFALIWAGLAVYTMDSVVTLRKQQKLIKQ